MSGQPGAHLLHQVTHTPALPGGLLGALLGAAAAVAVVATGGLALAVVAGAAGALAGGALGAMLGGAFAIKTGPIIPICALTVKYENIPAARVGDFVACTGIPFTPAPHPMSPIAQGSMTVFVENRPAARKGDMLGCSATISEGCSTVIIGGTASQTYLPMTPEIPSLGDMFNSIANSLIGAAMAVGDFVSDVIDAGVSVAVGIYDGAVALLNSAKTAIVNTYKSAKDTAVDAYESTKVAVLGAMSTAGDFIIDTAQMGKSVAIDAYDGGKSFISDKYNSFIDKTTFHKAESYDDLKTIYDWKEGDSIIVSKYRPLGDSEHQLLFHQDVITNVSHEHIIWLKPDGTIDNMGYGPDGLFREPTNFSSSKFGESKKITDNSNPIEKWTDSRNFNPTNDGNTFIGNKEDGYGLINYNCQKSADWLQESY